MTTTRSVAEIERDIERTRADIDLTLDHLRQSISPGQLLDQTMQYARAEGGEVGANVARRVKSNPLPLALLASSLAWLMVSDSKGPRADQEKRNDDRVRRYPETGGAYVATGYDPAMDGDVFDDTHHETITRYERVHGGLNDVKQREGESQSDFSDRLYQARAKALEIEQRAGEELSAFRRRIDEGMDDLSTQARHARERASQQAARLRERGRHWAGQAQAAAERAGHSTMAGARRVRRETGAFYLDNPLVVGALVMAAGAVMGGLLPSTRQEDDWMGETGDDLRSQASGYAKQAAGAAENVAEETLDAAKTATERETKRPKESNSASASGSSASRPPSGTNA